MSKIVTLYVDDVYNQKASFGEKVERAKVWTGTEIKRWPLQEFVNVPEGTSDEDAKAIRREAFFATVTRVESFVDRVAEHVALGGEIRIVVGHGRIFTESGEGEGKTWANVVGGSDLRDIAKIATAVYVAANSEQLI